MQGFGSFSGINFRYPLVKFANNRLLKRNNFLKLE